MAKPQGDEAPRVGTGITGLDEILGGGLPGRRLHLVQGPPGAGKTTLALQFLLEGLRRGEPCLYISLSESREELASVAASHGWDITPLSVFESASAVPEDENTLFESSEVELGERMDAILAEVDRVEPARVVIDSSTELRLLANTPARYRRQILSLKRQLFDGDRTVLLIENPSPGSPDVLMQSLAHGVITLDQLHPEFGGERRRLCITKMRAVAYHGGNHDCVIRTGGLVVFPRLVAAEHRGTVAAGPFPSGNAGLDRLLGGGIDRGTSTLVMGPAGAGKSALAISLAAVAARRGERAAVFLFDESHATLLARSRSLGVDLEPLLRDRSLTVQQIDPAEMSPGEFVVRVRAAVDEENARLVVIDSLNGLFQAMPDEHFLVLQLHEMFSYLGQRGVVTLAVLTQHGMLGPGVHAPADVSYLADTVILLRYFEVAGEVHKAISVMKKRTGRHETTVRDYHLGSDGIRIGEALANVSGILAGAGRPEPDPGSDPPGGA